MKKLFIVSILALTACGGSPKAVQQEQLYCTGQAMFTACPLNTDGGCYAAQTPELASAMIICTDALRIVQDCCDTSKVTQTTVASWCVDAHAMDDCLKAIQPDPLYGSMQTGERLCDMVPDQPNCTAVVAGNCSKIQAAGWCKIYAPDAGSVQ